MALTDQHSHEERLLKERHSSKPHTPVLFLLTGMSQFQQRHTCGKHTAVLHILLELVAALLTGMM